MLPIASSLSHPHRKPTPSEIVTPSVESLRCFGRKKDHERAVFVCFIYEGITTKMIIQGFEVVLKLWPQVRSVKRRALSQPAMSVYRIPDHPRKTQFGTFVRGIIHNCILTVLAPFAGKFDA